MITVDSEHGYGRNLNSVLDLERSSAYFLFCHHDVALAPDALRLMVEESLRSNAGIVGPKIVNWERPDELLDIGFSVDKLGFLIPRIESGELDQEQHDSVSDVFVVSSDNASVGIGTANPTALLTIQGNGLTDYIDISNASGDSLMLLNASGNIGVGTTSPSYKLHVSAGNDSITYYGPNSSWSSYLAVGAANDKTAANNTGLAQCISTNGNLHLDAGDTRSIYLCHYRGSSVLFGSTVIHGSDDRLKSEEELITNATDTLLKLNPQKYKKAYTLREDESREPFTESGLIAQDVWYDAPELRHLVHLGSDANPIDTKPEAPVDGDIQQDPDYSSWGTEAAALNYDGLIAYLIKSNQELHARIQALENA